MTRKEQQRDELVRAIDAIEGGYEFLLAYAAQGRHTDDAAGSHSPRAKLESMAEALGVLPGLATDMAAAGAESNGDFDAFLDALARDAAVSRAAIRLVLSRRDISSQIVDNLNASIHLRALLTDVFLIDEALKP